MAEESTYRYDIFISYSPADAEWALDWLLPRLTGAGLLVATPEESFRPGVPVLNETERCIRESRKIVAVLSQAYVADSAAEFEGLLVQHRDPAARLRRLIPIRLEAVDAPGRIALLGSVDMTDPARREAQIARIVAAVQGTDDLPELRYERIPDAAQRWWELRWFQIAGVASLLTLLLVAGWIWSQRPPPRPTAMPENNYNIAFAPFAPTNSDDPGASETAAEGKGRADEIALLLRGQSEDLSKLINRPVTVWGPADGVRAIAASEVESRTADLNADLLVYGTIERASDGDWQLQPLFYLADRTAQTTSANLAGELQGSHALGRAIRYSPSAELQGDANGEIQRRMEALQLLVRGFLYYSQESAAGYTKALREFEAATQSGWAQAEDHTGQEILYYFLGGAYLQQLIFAVEENASVDERREIIFNALDGYEKAIDLNANYLRAINGEAAGYVQLARLAQVEAGSTCGWDWGWLDEAAPLYAQVLDADDSLKLPGDNLDINAHLGLGRIAFTRSICGQADEWAVARGHYDAAIALYESERRPSQTLQAILAYRERGHTDFLNPDDRLPAGSQRLNEAIGFYRASVAVGVARNREQSLLMAQDSLIFLLKALCQNGEVDALAPTLDDFLTHLTEPDSVRDTIVNSAGFANREEECHNAIAQ
ncbi:MAG: toll/interleukin-1 receptor domain-containing protein [Caldilineaceae bacterium]|nr:toll/interleukin-1 receptor domain-containing protein [Caldilineaceae bacterium]